MESWGSFSTAELSELEEDKVFLSIQEVFFPYVCVLVRPKRVCSGWEISSADPEVRGNFTAQEINQVTAAKRFFFFNLIFSPVKEDVPVFFANTASLVFFCRSNTGILVYPAQILLGMSNGYYTLQAWAKYHITPTKSQENSHAKVTGEKSRIWAADLEV